MIKFNYKNAQSSPWGKVDNVKTYCRGLSFVGTPRHGGFRISKGLFTKLGINKEVARLGAIEWSKYYYFEEDCAYTLLLDNSEELLKIVAEKDGRDVNTYQDYCKVTARRWFPKYYEGEVKDGE